MSLITVSKGGVDIEPGTYTVTLVSIEGPKTITPRNGPNAGQDVEIFDWLFAIDDEGTEYHGTEIQATTSTASGPKSKLYGFITALLDGKAPTAGTAFEAGDLCGRVALATISMSDSGWPRIDTLSALPRVMRAPAAGRRAVPVPVAEAPADLPF
jgi:hypothetical protein